MLAIISNNLTSLQIRLSATLSMHNKLEFIAFFCSSKRLIFHLLLRIRLKHTLLKLHIPSASLKYAANRVFLPGYCKIFFEPLHFIFSSKVFNDAVMDEILSTPRINKVTNSRYIFPLFQVGETLSESKWGWLE